MKLGLKSLTALFKKFYEVNLFSYWTQWFIPAIPTVKCNSLVAKSI